MSNYSSTVYQERLEYRNNGAVDHILEKYFPDGEYTDRPLLDDDIDNLKFIGPLLSERCQSYGIFTIRHLLQHFCKNKRESTQESVNYFFNRVNELFVNVHANEKVVYKKSYNFPKYKIRRVNQGALTSVCMYIKNNMEVSFIFPNLGNISDGLIDLIPNYLND